jgi:hypothetical protein
MCISGGGGVLMHGGHVLDMHRPLGHFTEHVAGSEAISVGHDFGLVASRICT